jgi:magnesium transporter
METDEKKDDIEEPDRPDYEAELIKIIKSNDTPAQIKEKLNDYHDNDIASVLEKLTSEERMKLYKIIGPEEVSEVFSYLDDAEQYINELPSENAANIIKEMDADDAVDVLEDLQDKKKDELIKLVDEDTRNDINLINSYSEEEIGSKMTTNFIAIKRGSSIKQAMKSLIDQAADNDNLSTIYVVEQNDEFHGAIDLKDLIIAREYTDLESLVTVSYPFVYATETVDECIEQLKDYSEDSIPVLDNDKHLLGVITSQDIVEVVDEEMGEDYARLGGLTAEEDLNEPIKESVNKRLPWLVLLLFLGLGVSSTVGLFQTVITRLTVLVCFQSLILDMSGNVGTQSLAVTIRVLMDETLSVRQKIDFLLKEMRVGFFNGVILGVFSLVCIGLYVHFVQGMAIGYSFAVSGCFTVALILSMVISSFTGTIIPILFKKMKIDPAVASGPLITTVNDFVAVVLYYGLSWIFLLNILHMG